MTSGVLTQIVKVFKRTALEWIFSWKKEFNTNLAWEDSLGADGHVVAVNSRVLSGSSLFGVAAEM